MDGRADSGVETTLALRIEPIPEARNASVTLNDGALSGGATSGVWWEFGMPPSRIRAGVNRIEVAVSEVSPTAVSVLDAVLRVRYPQRR